MVAPGYAPTEILAHIPSGFAPMGWLFINANDLPVGLAAKLDFAGPPVEALNTD
jgi:hypothetical protein